MRILAVTLNEMENTGEFLREAECDFTSVLKRSLTECCVKDGLYKGKCEAEPFPVI